MCTETPYRGVAFQKKKMHGTFPTHTDPQSRIINIFIFFCHNNPGSTYLREGCKRTIIDCGKIKCSQQLEVGDWQKHPKLTNRTEMTETEPEVLETDFFFQFLIRPQHPTNRNRIGEFGL